MAGKKVLFTESQMEYIKENALCKPIFPRVNKEYNMFNSKGLLTEGIDERLLEGVFMTYSLKKIIKHLCQYLNFATDWETFRTDPKRYGGFLSVEEEENGENVIKVVVLNDESSLYIIKRCMRMCGYYEASNNMYLIPELRYLVFEPRVKERSKDGKKNTINKVVQEHRYIYHLTLVDRFERIMKNGLHPQTNMWDEYEYDADRIPTSVSRKNEKQTSEFELKNLKGKHPSRVYFFLKEPSFENAVSMGKDMFGKENINNLILITVDTANLDNDFYYDPNTNTGIFTEENVPPTNIIRVLKLEPHKRKVEPLYNKNN